MAIESITQAHIDRLSLAGPPSAKTERVYLDPRQRDYPDVGAGSPTFSAVYPYGDEVVGAWPLNDSYIDGPDEKVKDASGHGHHGTLVGGPTFVDGPAGGALEFDGTDDYVSIPAHADFTTNGAAFSISYIARLDTMSGLRCPFAKGVFSNSGLLHLVSFGALFVYYDDASLYFTVEGLFTQDVQATIVQTYDGAGTWLTYKDGNLFHTQTARTYVDAVDRILYFGANGGANYFWDGLIAEPRIYNRALTAAEVATLHANPPGPALTHNVPGSHYLSGGYSEHLVTMPDTFTIQVKFKPNFAFDTASNQFLFAWSAGATQRLFVNYVISVDRFALYWHDGGTFRLLQTATYDDGTSYRDIDAWITLTASIDLTTGTTLGSKLWMDTTLDDDTWNGNIDSKTTAFNKMQIRAYAGTAGDYDIAYVKMWPNLTIATLAELDTTKAEEIYWCMDGHPVGRTRCNVTSYAHSVEVEYSRNNPFSGAHSSNKASVQLRNTSGEFSDDQYAAFSPVNGVYNGLVTEKFLQNRNRVWIESHYAGDWDNVLVGQITQSGFARTTTRDEVGTVSIDVDDAVALLAEKRVPAAKVYVNDKLVAPVLADSLLHQVVKLGSMKRVSNYAADSSVAGTIGNSYHANGGVLTKEADGFFGTHCAQLANASGGERAIFSDIEFTGDEALNVGDEFALTLWLKSAAVVTAAVKLAERDGVVEKGETSVTYSLDGGEGYVKHFVTHTVTDAGSDRLTLVVFVPDGATIKVDGVHIYRGNRELHYYVANATEGTAGVISADSHAEGEYETIGFNLGSVDITHPWRRVETNSRVWNNVMSLAEASGAIYLGMDKNGTLQGVFYLGDTYTDPWVGRIIHGQRSGGTYALPTINTNIEVTTANKIVGRGVIIQGGIYNPTSMLWSARASGVFPLNEYTGFLEEVIPNGAAWPTADYGIMFAAYGLTSIETEYRFDDPSYSGHPYPHPKPSGRWFSTVRHGAVRDVIGAWVVRVNHRLSDDTNALTQTKQFFTANDWSTLRGDAARIELVNNTGSAKTLVDCYVLGRPVRLLAGDNGRIHDAFEDRADIERNGERVFEFGNDDVMDNTQLRKLAQYSWDYHKKKKHIYSVTLPGTRYDMTPGTRRYVMNIGGAGQTEYLNSVCEILYMKTRRTTGAAQTMVTLREVEERWKFTSNAVARILANAYASNPTDGTPTIIVASSTHASLQAHAYCDGTDDQVEIQAAIDLLHGSFGGGEVRLTRGEYSVSAKIDVKDSITLVGEGPSTIIRKGDYAEAAIDAVGTNGSEITVGIHGLAVTRDAAAENTQPLIRFTYCDNSVLKDCSVYDGWGSGIQFRFCDGSKIASCIVSRCGNPSIGYNNIIMVDSVDFEIDSNLSFDAVKDSGIVVAKISSATRGTITNNVVYGCDKSGIVAAGVEEVLISGNIIHDILLGGIYLSDSGGAKSNDCSVVGNRVSYSRYAITIGSGANHVVSSNIIHDNEYGITGSQTRDVTFTGNNVRDSSLGGGLNVGIRSTVTNNSILKNNGQGITVNGDDCSVSSNIVTSNAGIGIRVASGTGAVITGNRSTLNGGISDTASFENASTTVTNADTPGFTVGDPVVIDGEVIGTVASITNATTWELSVAFTGGTGFYVYRVLDDIAADNFTDSTGVATSTGNDFT